MWGGAEAFASPAPDNALDHRIGFIRRLHCSGTVVMPRTSPHFAFRGWQVRIMQRTKRGGLGREWKGYSMKARFLQLVGRLSKGMKLSEEPQTSLAKSDAAKISIEQCHDVWFVTWRRPRSRTRFLPSQIALYEAQRADQRGDVELAARLRWAATEAQSRNALNSSIDGRS
jgi:hypothetical protein